MNIKLFLKASENFLDLIYSTGTYDWDEDEDENKDENKDENNNNLGNSNISYDDYLQDSEQLWYYNFLFIYRQILSLINPTNYIKLKNN
jgi:hypothetical protein